MRNTPWTTVAVFVTSIAAIVVLIVSGHGNDQLVYTLTALLPTLTSASYYAERNNKQLSNGHMKDAVKQGITEMTAKAPPPKEDK